MKKRNKMFAMLTLCLLAIAVVSGGKAMAAADDIEFGFSIQPRNVESWDTTGGYRYRETSNTQNPWRIKMTITTDPLDTYTVYWLDNYQDSAQVSSKELIKHGDGYRYFTPYSSANGKNIKLAGADNNYSGSTYWTVGFWDEETW